MKFEAKMNSVTDRRQGRGGRGLGDRSRQPCRRLDLRASARLARPELAARRHRSDPLRPMRAIGFDALAGFAEDDALAAFRVFRGVGETLCGAAPLRAACPPRRRCLRPPRARRSADIADAEAARRVLRRAFRAAPCRARLPHRLLRALGRGRARAFAAVFRAAAGASRRSAPARPIPPAPRSKRRCAIPWSG